MRKPYILVSLVVLVVLGAGGFYLWQRTRSPEYSLLQMQKAVENHDLTTFEKYVDIEGISTGAVQGLTVALSEGEGGDMAEAIGNLLGPAFKGVIRQHIVDYVEKGSMEREVAASRTNPFAQLTSELGGQVEGVEYVKKEGKIAYAGLSFKPTTRDTTLTVVLRMRDRDGYWQVADVANLHELLQPSIEERRERSYLSTMKSDLRNLATAQEIYYSDLNRFTYTRNLPRLEFVPSAGVQITIVSASSTGWSAIASHINTKKQCAIYYGDASAVGPATQPGVVSCSP